MRITMVGFGTVYRIMKESFGKSRNNKMIIIVIPLMLAAVGRVVLREAAVVDNQQE